MWKRRELLNVLGASAAGLALFPGAAAVAENEDDGGDARAAALKHSCRDTCGDCAKACNKAYHFCLEQATAGKAGYAKLAQFVSDCAAFCALSAEMIARQSALMVFSCHACADACQSCRQACESMDSDIDIKMCIDACQKCEESCRNMVKSMGNAR